DRDRERDPRELAARGDPADRARLHSRMAGDQELHPIDPARTRLGRLDADAQAGARHAEVADRLGDLAFEPPDGGTALARQGGGERFVVVLRAGYALAQ